MLRNKKIFFLSLILFILLMIPTIANAAETFKTSDGIVATKIVEGTDGTVNFKFTNINLSSEENYTWGISKTPVESGVEKWFTLGDYTVANKTAIITLTPSDKKILEILRTTNTAYIFIKDNKANKNIVNGLKVDLTLPPLKAFKVTKTKFYGGIPTLQAYTIAQDGQYGKSTYGIKNVFYKFIKITDTTLVSQYQQAIIQGKDLSTLNLAKLSDSPTTGWNTCALTGGNNVEINNQDLPKDPGVYYLWLKGKDTDSKTVIGYNVIGIDTEGPIVESIKITSPASGTYKTGQTVEIVANFNEVITGSSVPTLKVKFGESEERTLTNGTISGKTIKYSYNIQASDKGQLATVSYAGGSIKDASGNEAKISCPIISGYTIKANVEGTVTNNTENQDKTNNNANNNANGNTNNNSNNGTTNNSGNTNQKPISTNNQSSNGDTTKATGKLPQTGEGIIITMVAILIIGIGIFCYTKYNKYKEI